MDDDTYLVLDQGGKEKRKMDKKILSKDKAILMARERWLKEYHPKSKHNKWVEGFEAGATFFKWISSFGYSFVVLVCAVSSAIFLVQFGISNPDYLGVVVILLQLLRLGVWMLIIGVVLSWLCKWWAEHLYRKELKVIEGVAYGRDKKRIT